MYLIEHKKIKHFCTFRSSKYPCDYLQYVPCEEEKQSGYPGQDPGHPASDVYMDPGMQFVETGSMQYMDPGGQYVEPVVGYTDPGTLQMSPFRAAGIFDENNL